jgi:hypothetical protein
MSEAEPHLLSEFDLKGRNILLVDDDRLNTRLLSGMLDSEGGKTAAVPATEGLWKVPLGLTIIEKSNGISPLNRPPRPTPNAGRPRNRFAGC